MSTASIKAHIDEVVSVYICGITSKCLVSAIGQEKKKNEDGNDDDANSSSQKPQEEKHYLGLPPMPPLALATAAAAAATSAAAATEDGAAPTAAAVEPPPHVKWSHRATLAVDSFFPMTDMPAMSASKTMMMSHMKDNTINAVQWLSIGAALLFYGKLAPAEQKAWLAKQTPAAVAALEKAKEVIAVACKRKKGSDCMFAQGPPREWYLDEFLPAFPGMELAVVRSAGLSAARMGVKAPHYESCYNSEGAKWFRDLGIACLFYSMPTMLLVMQGVVVPEPIPTDEAARNAAFASVLPEEIPSSNPQNDIAYGWKEGKAPRLPNKGTVCIVSQAIIKQCFGVEPTLNVYYQSDNPLPGADTLPYVDIANVEGDWQEFKCRDVCVITWPAFRKLLNWFGGGPFVGLTLMVDDKEGIVTIARPVTLRLFTPDPTKCSNLDSVYVCFELKTRETDWTVAQAIDACLEEGDSSFNDGRSSYVQHNDNEKFDENKVVDEAKGYLKRLVSEQHKLDKAAVSAAAAAAAAAAETGAGMPAQQSSDGATDSASSPKKKTKKVTRSEHRLIEITTGSKVNEYDGAAVKDLDANARVALSARSSSYSSHDKTVLSFVVFEAGTADQYGSKAGAGSSSYGGYGSLYGSQGGSTHPGWVGLQNLGNTCYMNAALQCLSHAKPHVNRVLACGDSDFPEGKVPEPSFVNVWKDLLDNMWNKADSARVFSPDNLKKQVGKKYSRFAGYEQQDSIEFVTMWLDLLHEELNPKHGNKKFRERGKEDNGIPIPELSRLYWEDCRDNNKTFVHDQWYGQMHSDIQCMACGHLTTIFDPFASLAVSLKEMETVPFDVPVYFVSTAAAPPPANAPAATASPSSTTNNDGSNFARPPSDEGLLDPNMPRIHCLNVRVRVTKGSSVRDLMKEVHRTLDNDPEAARMGLKLRAWQEISILRVSYNKTLYCTSPIERTTDYHDYAAFASGDNMEVRRVIEEYTQQYNDYTKELREDEEKRKQEQKEKEKAEKEAKEKAGTSTTDAAAAPGAADAPSTTAPSTATTTTTTTPAGGEDAATSSSATTTTTAAEEAAADKKKDGDDDDEDAKAPVTSSGRRKPKEPLFHTFMVKIEPSAADADPELAKLAGALVLPCVVPAKATHRDIYDASVRTASFFLAPLTADTPHPTKAAVPFMMTALAANSWESNKPVTPDDNVNVFCPNGGKPPKKKESSGYSSYYTSSYYSGGTSGPTLYGVGFDKGATELRFVNLVYDASCYRPVGLISATHSSKEKVPGPGWKAPPVTLESCIADSAMPQELTGQDQFYCPACKQHQDARKTETVMRLPPLLCVHLKRFHLNYETFTYSKNNTSVPYPEVLDVGSAVSQIAKAAGVSTTYRLFGSVHHSGSLSFGHYTAVVAAEKPVEDPDAAKEAAAEEEKKKKEEEEEKKATAKKDEEKGTGADASVVVAKKIHFKDPDAMIAQLYAKIEADAAAKKRREEEEAAAKAKAEADGGASAAAAAGEEAARKRKEEEEKAEAEKKKKKREMKRVWLDCNDSWVTELDPEKAHNATSAYVLFYERIDEPAEGADAADE